MMARVDWNVRVIEAILCAARGCTAMATAKIRVSYSSKTIPACTAHLSILLAECALLEQQKKD